MNRSSRIYKINIKIFRVIPLTLRKNYVYIQMFYYIYE